MVTFELLPEDAQFICDCLFPTLDSYADYIMKNTFNEDVPIVFSDIELIMHLMDIAHYDDLGIANQRYLEVYNEVGEAIEAFYTAYKADDIDAMGWPQFYREWIGEN